MSEQDENDVHSVETEVANYHFNVLKIVRDAAQAFEAKTTRKAAFFYAPEFLLYLIDMAVKTGATKIAGGIPDGAVVTHVFGMELRAVEGTCVTVSAEPLDSDVPDSGEQPFITVIPNDQGVN